MIKYFAYGYGMQSSVWSLIMFIGILIIVISSAIALAKSFQRTVPVYADNSVSKTIEILNESYACGKISYEEYKRILAQIKN